MTQKIRAMEAYRRILIKSAASSSEYSPTSIRMRSASVASHTHKVSAAPGTEVQQGSPKISNTIAMESVRFKRVNRFFASIGVRVGSSPENRASTLSDMV